MMTPTTRAGRMLSGAAGKEMDLEACAIEAEAAAAERERLAADLALAAAAKAVVVAAGELADYIEHVGEAWGDTSFDARVESLLNAVDAYRGRP